MLWLSHLEGQLFTSRAHLQRIPLLDVPSQELLGQRILQVFLHGSAHWSSAVGWIVALIDQKLDCGRIQVNLDILGACSKNFSRILLIKPSALGDVVHTIPVLPKLRVRFPTAQIDWLITPENAGLVRHHPDLSNVVLFDRQKFAQLGRNWTATTELLRLLRQLWQARYDLVIDLHGQMRSALITLATGASVRVGFDRPIRRTRPASGHHSLRNFPRHGWTGAREGSWVAYSHHIPISTLDVHAIDRYLWLTPILGLNDSPIDTRIYLSAEIEAAAHRLLEQCALQQFGALVPGTLWETKHWHPERFAEVGQWLKKQGFDVVILGSKHDRRRCEEREIDH